MSAGSSLRRPATGSGLKEFQRADPEQLAIEYPPEDVFVETISPSTVIRQVIVPEPPVF